MRPTVTRQVQKARRTGSRLRRGQAMVEYSFLNYWLVIGLCLMLSADVFPGKKNLIDLFLAAYQMYYDSFYFMLNLPIP
jgi:hypothetical protein